jgi:hypothetical protein
MKNMGSYEVCCRHYDWSSLDMCQRYDRSSLDVCQCYDRSSLDVYLPMLLSVSCGKNDFSHFVASRRPSEQYSMAILLCSAYSLLLSTNVGKEMPISRIVVAVPNSTVVILD